MTPHEVHVAHALSALVIVDGSPTWLGESVAGPPTGQAPPADGRLGDQIHACLYANFYVRGGVAPAGVGVEPSSARLRTAFAARLSAANNGGGSVEAGWCVHALDGDDVVVERDGLRLWAPPSRIVSAEAPRPGLPVELIVPGEAFGLSAGFYTALGDAPLPADGAGDRFYWNCTPEGAVRLVDEATRLLNERGLPYRLKVVDEPERFGRCDAGVLYLPRGARARAVEAVAILCARLAPWLMPRTPVFTRPIGPGVGFAEDPGGGESFGSHRCRLMAEAIARAHRDGRRSSAERMAFVRDGFAAAGISLARPYLGPGSLDDISVPTAA